MPDKRWRRLHPSFLLFELGALARRYLVPLVIGGTAAVQMEREPSHVLLVIMAVSGLLLVTRYLTFRYALEERQIIIKEGLLSRRAREIPIRRINHVETRDNPLSRALKVTELQILTEGTGGPEAVLPAVSLREADRITRHVSDRGHLTETGAPEARAVIYAADWRSTLLAGVTAFNLWVVLGTLALVQANVSRYLDENVVAEWLRSLTRDTAVSLADQNLAFWVGAVAVIIVLLLLLNVALAYVRWWRFTVTREGAELEIESGFLARARARINDGRLHGIHVYGNGLRRLLGYTSISVVAPRQGSDQAKRASPVIPITPRSAVPGHLEEIWPALGGWQTALRPVDTYHRQYQFRRLLLVLTAVAALVTVASGSWIPPVVIAALALPGWYVVRANVAATGYQLTDLFLVAQAPGLGYSLWVVPRVHLQGVLLTESVFQRRRGLVTLEADINGLTGRIRVPNISRDEAEGLRADLLRSLVIEPDGIRRAPAPA